MTIGGYMRYLISIAVFLIVAYFVGSDFLERHKQEVLWTELAVLERKYIPLTLKDSRLDRCPTKREELVNSSKNLDGMNYDQLRNITKKIQSESEKCTQV